MLNKLALRNAGRLWKDYLLYFLTLSMIVSLMFSFHSLLFSKDIYEMIHFGNSGELSTAGTMLIAFMAISTVVIFVISAWLIQYMARFILERRSKEFALYLLAGMKKKQMVCLYSKENFYLGICALCAGLLLGCGTRQALFFAFYKSIGKHYELMKQSLQANAFALLLTVILYGVCFIVALIWSKNRFFRMEIIHLLRMDRQNETMSDKHSILWKRLFFLSLGNIVLFYFLFFTGRITKWTAMLEMIGLTVTFYVFYLGLSAFLMKYIEKKGRLIYKRDAIFLMRQFSSKMHNTCFVLGTLSLLFLFALVGSSLAFMLSDYQKKQLDVEYPFDVIMFSDRADNDFSREEALIRNRIKPREIKNESDRLQNSLHTELTLAGVYTEGFAQNGHNGTDYLLVVPDQKIAEMKPYFSLMAVMADGNVPESLSEDLYDLEGKTRGYDELADYIKIGSEELFLMPATIQVKSREVLELKFLMSTLSFPLFYIGLVFLLVAFTILSVRQMSDSHKYQFRYRILYRLGMRRKKINGVVAKQMFLYYFCPILVATAISAAFVLFVGKQFVVYTGIQTAGALYFCASCGGFLGMYVLYFGLTYAQCRKDVGNAL